MPEGGIRRLRRWEFDGAVRAGSFLTDSPLSPCISSYGRLANRQGIPRSEP